MNKLFKKYVLRAAVIGSLAVGLCGSAMAATPATAPEQGQISVSASASRTISPTYALLSLGISTSAADVGQAKVENDRVMSAVVSRLQALGVTKNNIKTSYFNVNPQYDYSANNGGANKVKGYTVTNRVTVRINDLNNVSKIIDGTVNAGATSVDSLQFNADITPDLTDQLITEAVKSGRHQADVVAAAAGE
ncbi:MAG: SIMPL domain-containing protein, partial [Veillonella sp.]|nr:SIMPL domain-containing protein [Veillonella sp.]